MFQIDKDEPRYFTSAKLKVKLPKVKNAWNDENISAIREVLREDILIKEQKGLCAYCEKKISSSSTSSNIDHFKTRNLFPEKTLDYNNLLVSCNTKERCSSLKDSHKSLLKRKEDYGNIINPVIENPNSFFDYLLSGEMIPLDEKAKFTIELFDLNHQSLYDERKILADTLQYCLDLSLDEIYDNFGYEFQSFIQNIYPKLKEL